MGHVWARPSPGAAPWARPRVVGGTQNERNISRFKSTWVGVLLMSGRWGQAARDQATCGAGLPWKVPLIPWTLHSEKGLPLKTDPGRAKAHPPSSFHSLCLISLSLPSLLQAQFQEWPGRPRVCTISDSCSLVLIKSFDLVIENGSFP